MVPCKAFLMSTHTLYIKLKKKSITHFERKTINLCYIGNEIGAPAMKQMRQFGYLLQVLIYLLRPFGDRESFVLVRRAKLFLFRHSPHVKNSGSYPFTALTVIEYAAKYR